MNIHFKFVISFFAIIPLFVPFQIEYIDALDFDNDSLEESFLPYINTIKNDNYKKQKINIADIIEMSTEKEKRSEIETTTKEDNDNISDQSAIKQVEENTLNENFTIYDGLGIKLENYTPWTIVAKSDKSTCYNINLCFLHLGILNGTNMPQTWIIQDSFESQTITEQCKCNILEDYIRYFYTNTISQFPNFSFINENKTTLSKDRLAIQLEYEFTPADTKIHTFSVFTKDNDDSFYQFIYYSDQESFVNYLSDFKKIIDTVEFTLQKES
jgi:hypothetical protein